MYTLLATSSILPCRLNRQVSPVVYLETPFSSVELLSLRLPGLSTPAFPELDITRRLMTCNLSGNGYVVATSQVFPETPDGMHKDMPWTCLALPHEPE